MNEIIIKKFDTADESKPHVLEKRDLFYVSFDLHDSWLLGDQKYISLHLLGAEKYAL
tara:strand:- start:294 stop:464 length:171 start_codon:yes stop_codon:yes gene_type:complete